MCEVEVGGDELAKLALIISMENIICAHIKNIISIMQTYLKALNF